MKLTPDNISSKLGRKVDLATLQELDLSSQGFTETSSFSRLKALEILDLSTNRFQLIRHIKGLFDLPRIKQLKLKGNPVTKAESYRLTVIAHLPSLQILDDIEITDKEREQSKSIIVEVKDPLLNPGSSSSTTSEDNDILEANVKEPEPPKKVVAEPKPVESKPTPTPAPKPVESKPTPTPAPKPVESKPTPAPKPVEEQTKPTPKTVEKKDEDKPIEKEIKKKLVFVDEDTLFGESKPKSKLQFDEDDKDQDKLLFGNDDDDSDLKVLEKKSVKKQETKKVSSISFTDDDDDLFSSKSKPKTTGGSTAKNDDLDDLFSSFGGSQGGDKSISKEFDVSSYIESQKNRKKSSLFDD